MTCKICNQPSETEVCPECSTSGIGYNEVKHCKKCGKELPLELFYNDKSFKDGKSRYCRECTYGSQKNKYKSSTIKKKFKSDNDWLVEGEANMKKAYEKYGANKLSKKL